jgi:hypothetical protein
VRRAGVVRRGGVVTVLLLLLVRVRQRGHVVLMPRTQARRHGAGRAARVAAA